MPINENTLENVIIDELKLLGYNHLYGPDIERDYHEVILEDYFKDAMFNINPGITYDIVLEAYRIIKENSVLKLEDINANFHKLLIEGIPVPYKKNGENRIFTVKLIDFEIAEKNDFKVINQFTVID